MCLNGGKLHLCDHCPQAVCHQCLPPPHDLDISKLDFVCLACHEVAFKTEPRQPYYVSCQVTLLRCLPLIRSCLHLVGVLCLFQARHKYASSDAWPLETRHSPAPCHPRPISNDLPLPSQLQQPPYSPFYLFWRILRPLALPHACYTNTSRPSLHTMMWLLKRSCSTWGTLSGVPHMSMWSISWY